MKSCFVCDAEIEGPQFRHYCSECRPKVSEIQRQARAAMGDIPPASNYKCVDCGSRATAYDHRYYGLPHEVDPVCTRCNIRRGPALDLKDHLKGIQPPKDWHPILPKGIPGDLQKLIDDVERESIRKALELTKWNASKAARKLGVSFRSMRYRMERLGFSRNTEESQPSE